MRVIWAGCGVWLLAACSFTSEPLLAGQRGGVDEEHAPASGSDRDSGGGDPGTQTPPAPNAGAGGSVNGGNAGAPPADAGAPATNVDAASPSMGMDAAPADDAAPTPDADPPPDPDPDPMLDATIEPDSGKPPECKCVCPHELKAVLTEPRPVGCQLVECPQAECAPEPDCEFVANRASGYYLCPEPHDWEGAVDHCDDLAGVALVSVDDEIENDFLFDQIDGKAWTGGNDLEKEGDFRWPNGKVFWRGGPPQWDQGGGGPGPGGPGPGGDMGGAAPPGVYTNFLAYEPNDEGLGEEPADCVLLYPNEGGDTWADGSCDNENAYVCEFALPPKP